jgi:plasmid stabilization system protein ParE
MAGRKIVWTKRANKSFNHIIDYIFTTFGENATKSFVKGTYDHIERLSKYPNMGTLENQ